MNGMKIVVFLLMTLLMLSIVRAEDFSTSQTITLGGGLMSVVTESYSLNDLNCSTTQVYEKSIDLNLSNSDICDNVDYDEIEDIFVDNQLNCSASFIDVQFNDSGLREGLQSVIPQQFADFESLFKETYLPQSSLIQTCNNDLLSAQYKTGLCLDKLNASIETYVFVNSTLNDRIVELKSDESGYKTIAYILALANALMIIYIFVGKDKLMKAIRRS